MKAAMPTPRQIERVHLQCHACGKDAEIAVDTVMDGWAICPTPSCGQVLIIRWTALTKVSK